MTHTTKKTVIYDTLVPPTPGAARCSLQRWVPEKKLTPTEVREAKEAGLARRFVQLDSERLDRGQGRHGRWEVAYAACEGFETTDGAAFEAHMLEHHSRKLGTYLAGYNEAFSRSIRAGWRGPRLYADGQDVPKAAAEHLTQCPTCELYAETDTTASELWWAEHLRGCALAAQAVPA